MVNTKYLALLLFAPILLFSCKKDKQVVENGYGYYPTDVGRYVVYDVDSLVYREFTMDTVDYKYQLKEVIQSVFTDNQGRPSIRIERYIKKYNPAIPYAALPWTLRNVCYATKTSRTVERVEDNTRFVRFTFPVTDRTYWNGNAQNSMGDWEYQYKGVDQSQGIGPLHFDSVATVIQRDETNLIARRYYKEQYAKNTGLVYKQILDVYDNSIVAGIPVVNRIKGGVSYIQTINSFGHQ